ncbi:hypothetical protein PHAVU_006G025200 [Phaseolus vulgaris]|uniref:Uncharacterized protein n=1 Tax=Phaseolus vulgaris TaxID=3885 RepID=V7BMI8_PHAVU|nr:hypothetical protein PHAVU_006G025200g [Phaseolus vulgaris]ESW18248.1 hypothetical protein PHAVU_006G025200g [Phaseolus vulgaris]
MHHFLLARLTTRSPHFGVLCHNAILFFNSRTLSVSNTKHHKGDTFNSFSIINSCGLSPKTALEFSKRLELKNPDGANAVIDLLGNYGFSETQLCSLVKKLPSVLLSNPDKTLLPKLKFFRSIGFSPTDLPTFLVRKPTFLKSSLEKTIRPCYVVIRSLVRCDKEVVSTLKNGLWHFNSRNVVNNSLPNIEALRQLGLPQGSISLLVANFPSVTFMKHAGFVEAVEKVKEMGFDPLKTSFVMALKAFADISEASWKSKLEVLEKCGWSSDISLLAFKKHPQFMVSSESKILKIMSFLTKDVGLAPEEIARCPALLKCNLEKTVIPRFAVIKILKRKGLIKSDLKISTFIKISEKVFLEKYVTRFQSYEPLVLAAYKGQKSN